ncbi:M23 family metallopeptidase [Citreimonas salinaria]|uniref:Peptidase family M23 n=1 Tax=Citreimonas salinaria TaxID=321339 RepID=A0A1H3HNV8_9RHOB|nr:M23 family metallopeptidase [Citreimonas salinaria]SDY17132.1 Peptidase family M23 [Citreimonas salinaria]
MRSLALTMLISAAGTLAAEPFLGLPIACEVGTTCFIEDYVDTDPTPGTRDYTCGLKAREGHRGTDLALPDMAAMNSGVPVLAAAPGGVEAVRDGVPDRVMTAETAGTIAEIECGNAVRIGHANGLKTLYCHLREGSVAVASGTSVEAGDALGMVGLSGQTTFPHLHFALLQGDGTAIDPFAAEKDCGPSAAGYWTDPPAYVPTGFHTAGFATALPDMAAVRDGSARASSARPDDALVLYGFVFLAEPGDVLHLRAEGPEGEIFDRRIRIDESRAQLFRAFGRRAPDTGWPPGAYRGDARLTRDDTLIGARQAYIKVSAD